MTPPHELQALLAQSGWVQELARRLVPDPAAAEDLAQSTLVDALERPPAADRPLRGWLATVMRNNLGKLRRGEANRHARERDSARHEAQPSTFDVVEKASSHRDVVLAVMGLEEPYRTTLLLRFFEGCSYREIARQSGVTRAAVNSRVTRGLDELRRRLESRYGDQRALAVALLPLAFPTGKVAKTFAVGKVLAIALTGATTVAAVAFGTGFFEGGSRAAEPLAGYTGEGRGRKTTVREPLTPPRVHREPLESLPQPEPEASEPLAAQGPTRTRLLGPEVEWVEVDLSSGDVEIRPSAGPALELTVRMRVDEDLVPEERRSQDFDDHLRFLDKGAKLRIEDLHRGEEGWHVLLVLGVPEGVSLDVNTSLGEVRVRKGTGRTVVNVGEGNVAVDLAGGLVESLNLNTGRGDLALDFDGVTGRLDANTGGGDLVARMTGDDAGGRVRLNSAEGDVRVHVRPGHGATFSMKSDEGVVDLAADLGFGVVGVDTSSVELIGLGGEGAGRVHLSTRNGVAQLAPLER